jgi:hypothetical protein
VLLSVSVTVFRSYPPVTTLIFVATFCFVIHGLMMADLKRKYVKVAEVYILDCNLCSSDNISPRW